MIRKDKHIESYCCEPIENIEGYEEAVADKTQIYHCHHRLEVQGPFRNSRELLIKCGMYYDRPASELVFLSRSAHFSLHKKGREVKRESVEKLVKSLKARAANPDARKQFITDQPARKEVHQYCMDGKLKAVYLSLRDVERKTGLSRANVAKCCAGRCKSAYGYVWRFKI